MLNLALAGAVYGLAPTPESQVRIRLPAGGRWIRTLGPPLRTAFFRDHPGNRRLRNRPGSQNRILAITSAGFTVRRAGLASRSGADEGREGT
jgi:hypothetical protein